MNCPNCQSDCIEEVDRKYFRGGLIVLYFKCGECGEDWESEEIEEGHEYS